MSFRGPARNLGLVHSRPSSSSFSPSPAGAGLVPALPFRIPRAGIHKRGAAHPEHRRRVERGAALQNSSRSPSPHVIPRPRAEARTPLPKGRGMPFALSGVEGSQERNGGAPPTPKCDINPLTLLKHLYYLHLRLARHHTHDLRRTQHPGKTTGLPRTQRPSPSREPAHAAPGSSERRHLLSQVPRLPFPHPGDGRRPE